MSDVRSTPISEIMTTQIEMVAQSTPVDYAVKLLVEAVKNEDRVKAELRKLADSKDKTEFAANLAVLVQKSWRMVLLTDARTARY